MSYYLQRRIPMLQRLLELKLRSSIAVMDQRRIALGLTGVKRLLQRIEHELGTHGAADTPAHDPAGEHINDEGHVQPALPG